MSTFNLHIPTLHCLIATIATEKDVFELSKSRNASCLWICGLHTPEVALEVDHHEKGQQREMH